MILNKEWGLIVVTSVGLLLLEVRSDLDESTSLISQTSEQKSWIPGTRWERALEPTGDFRRQWKPHWQAVRRREAEPESGSSGRQPGTHTTSPAWGGLNFEILRDFIYTITFIIKLLVYSFVFDGRMSTILRHPPYITDNVLQSQPQPSHLTPYRFGNLQTLHTIALFKRGQVDTMTLSYINTEPLLTRL